MEIIITLVVLGLAAYWFYDMSQNQKKSDETKLDNWEPPKDLGLTDKPWPFGEKLSEGKIHVKSSDVAPGKSAADRVETPAPVVTNSTPADNVPVAEAKPAKKAPAKKTAAKPAVAKTPAKKAPAKKKST